MKGQHVDNILFESLVSTTSLKSLAKGYILNCKTEGKSPKTISITEHRWNSTSPAAKRQVTSTTVNGYFRALRTFFNWLQREEFVIENSFKNLKPPKINKKVIQTLSPAEIGRLFKLCSGKSPPDVRNKAILSVSLDTGLRISELTELTIDDVDVDNVSLLIKHGKGDKGAIPYLRS